MIDAGTFDWHGAGSVAGDPDGAAKFPSLTTPEEAYHGLIFQARGVVGVRGGGRHGGTEARGMCCHSTGASQPDLARSLARLSPQRPSASSARWRRTSTPSDSATSGRRWRR